MRVGLSARFARVLVCFSRLSHPPTRGRLCSASVSRCLRTLVTVLVVCDLISPFAIKQLYCLCVMTGVSLDSVDYLTVAAGALARLLP